MVDTMPGLGILLGFDLGGNGFSLLSFNFQ